MTRTKYVGGETVFGGTVKIKISALLVVIFVLANFSAMAAESSASSDAPALRVFSLNAGALQTLHDRIVTGRFSHVAIDKLRSDANKALAMEPVSVMQKSITPPSGSKHDYMSLSRYWWPDPTKPGGLPYIRRDGEVNPEIEQIPDHENLNRLITATQRLSLAYYFTGEEKYAAQATRLLRVWFLDPATRMNPNLQYAQATRGRNTGKGSGLIDSRRLSYTVDYVGLLAGSKSWGAAEQKGMQDWFAAYLKWLVSSNHGRDEAQARNNHGSYYDTQVASIALFTGDRDLATKILKNETKRIAMQIEKDGSQPLELERTRSLWYSCFNLAALFQLAQLGENVGVDLWSFTTSDGRSMRKALGYLAPYVTGEKKWPYKQIDEFRKEAVLPLYLTARAKYNAPEYERVAQTIHPGPSDDIECLIATFTQIISLPEYTQ